MFVRLFFPTQKFIYEVFVVLFFSFIATDKNNILIVQDCIVAVNLKYAFGFIFSVSRSKIVAVFPHCFQTTAVDKTWRG